MRETVKDWKQEWIETNGETEELEVLIENSNLSDNAPYIYEGSFVSIPKELEEKKVIDWAKILTSSEPARIGSYKLII